MKKQLKRYGNNLVLVFTHEEEGVYGLKEGQIIDFDFKVVGKEARR